LSRERRRVRPAYLALVLLAFVATLYAGSYFRSAAPQEPAPAAALPVPSSDVLVQVLNESHVEHGAQRVARLLRERGFDVVEIGNGTRVGRTETEVLGRTADVARGLQVAKTLNCGRFQTEEKPDLLLDVTVLVGQDIERIVALPD
jgi:hypothetical protein